MTDTITILETAITAGMTTGHGAADDYFVKTIYTGDPLQLPSFECPACSVVPVQPISRSTVFIGEDSITETFQIRFYQLAVRKNGEAAEMAAAFTRLRSMYQKAEVLLRTDPTFSAQLVNSEIKSVNPQLPGQAGGDAYRIAEIIIETTNRAMWGS